MSLPVQLLPHTHTTLEHTHEKLTHTNSHTHTHTTSHTHSSSYLLSPCPRPTAHSTGCPGPQTGSTGHAPECSSSHDGGHHQRDADIGVCVYVSLYARMG